METSNNLCKNPPVYLSTAPSELHLLVRFILQTFQATVEIWLWHFVWKEGDSEVSGTSGVSLTLYLYQ